MKTIPLDELFTPEQLQRVRQITKNTPEDKLTAALKEYLNSIGEQLIAKGAYPDYLAYYFTYILSRGVKI